MTRRYSFRCGVTLEQGSATGPALIAGGKRLPLDSGAQPTPETAAALACGERTLAELAEATGRAPEGLAPALDYFDRLGLLRHTVADEHGMVLSLDPMSGRSSAVTGELRPGSCPGTPVVLSRFTFAHRHGQHLVLESPLSNYRATLWRPEVAGLLVPLACADPGSERTGAAAACVELLLHAGLAGPARDDVELAGWTFHDLLFHSRSRPGMHDYPIGRTYPLRGTMPPLPAVPPRRGPRQSLPVADIGRLSHQDQPFTAVVERRHSVRRYGTAQITLRNLGEFLHRCARIRRIIPADPPAGVPYESSERPYPSGGGAYDIEIYVVVRSCTGLAQGVYHYTADAHALDRVAEPSRWTEALLTDAAKGSSLTGSPQVLLVLTTRFGRISWKYSGMAYATTLKNVGVLFQTMYLVATAMALAPCAVGTGNPLLLARVLNLPVTEESSVGEFLLGTT